jgi:hypothetical protein
MHNKSNQIKSLILKWYSNDANIKISIIKLAALMFVSVKYQFIIVALMFVSVKYQFIIDVLMFVSVNY